MKVKKISFGNWSDFLTDNEMKATIGGGYVEEGHNVCWSVGCVNENNGCVITLLRSKADSTCESLFEECECFGGTPASCSGVWCD